MLNSELSALQHSLTSPHEAIVFCLACHPQVPSLLACKCAALAGSRAWTSLAQSMQQQRVCLRTLRLLSSSMTLRVKARGSYRHWYKCRLSHPWCPPMQRLRQQALWKLALYLSMPSALP